MATSPVNVRFVYDDALDEVIMLVDMPAPPPPPEHAEDDTWVAPEGGTWTVTNDKVKAKNAVAVPVAFYTVAPVPPATMPQRWRVEYRDGAWQLPGTQVY